MISRLKGTLIHRDPEGRVEVETAGGVVYELHVPLSVLQRLPAPPVPDFEIRTLQVVREDSVALYGFREEGERDLFRRLMSASGVGPSLALAMLSTFSAHRLARALVEKDLNALKQVSGVGKKTAERLVLELADKVGDLAVSAARGEEDAPASRAAQEAVSALVALGYAFTDADAAVRAVVEEGEVESTDELIRRALQRR